LINKVQRWGETYGKCIYEDKGSQRKGVPLQMQHDQIKEMNYV